MMRMSSLGIIIGDIEIFIFAPNPLVMCERESEDAHAGAIEYIETQRGVVRISCGENVDPYFFDSVRTCTHHK